jgi:hypothetical protein
MPQRQEVIAFTTEDYAYPLYCGFRADYIRLAERLELLVGRA